MSSYKIGIFNKHAAGNAEFKLALVELCHNGSVMPRILPEFLGFAVVKTLDPAEIVELSVITLPTQGMGSGSFTWNPNWKRLKLKELPPELAELVCFTHIGTVELVNV
jgi:hypothetical protein